MALWLFLLVEDCQLLALGFPAPLVLHAISFPPIESGEGREFKMDTS